MAWDLTALAEYVKLPARFYTAGALVAAVLLFAPAPALRFIALDEFAREHRALIGLTFLVMTVLALTQLGVEIYQALKRRREKSRSARDEETVRAHTERRERETLEANQRKLLERLSDLSTDEQAMLRQFVINNVRSRRLPMNSAVRHALHGSGILASAAQVTEYDHALGDYAIESFIQPWALKALRDQPDLVGLTYDELL